MTHVFDRPSRDLIRRSILEFGWIENGPLLVGLGLLVVGLGLLVMGAGLFIGVPSSPLASDSAAIPDRPAPPIVTPANATLALDAAPMDFTTALPLEQEDSTSQVRSTGADQNAKGPNENVPLPAQNTGNGHRAEQKRPETRDSSADPSVPFHGLAITYEDQRKRYRQLVRKPGTEASLELFGLVVDETMTRMGRDFYNKFYDLWQAPPTREAYTIRIQEKPMPGRSTMIGVLVNDDVTYQTRVQRSPKGVGDRPLQAARRTYAYIQSGRGVFEIF